MKIFLILAALLSLTACASVEKNYANSVSIFGIDLGLDPVTYLPLIRMGYVTSDTLVINNGTDAELKREYAGSVDSGMTEASPWELNKQINIKADSARGAK